MERTYCWFSHSFFPSILACLLAPFAGHGYCWSSGGPSCHLFAPLVRKLWIQGCWHWVHCWNCGSLVFSTHNQLWHPGVLQWTLHQNGSPGMKWQRSTMEGGPGCHGPLAKYFPVAGSTLPVVTMAASAEAGGADKPWPMAWKQRSAVQCGNDPLEAQLQVLQVSPPWHGGGMLKSFTW